MSDRLHRRNVPAARELRGRETVPEDLLWNALRDRRLDGYKFRRQHPVGRFEVDFCCLERRLAVEIDGEIHDRQRERDAEREAVLTGVGWRVLRVPNAEVRNEFQHVLAKIRAALREPPSEDGGHSPRP